MCVRWVTYYYYYISNHKQIKLENRWFIYCYNYFVFNNIPPFFQIGDSDVVDTSKMSFLHGRIRIFVDRAEGLHDTDTAFWNIDRKVFTDPYVTGDLGEDRIFKTRYILNSLDPVWEQTFNIHVCHHAER